MVVATTAAARQAESDAARQLPEAPRRDVRCLPLLAAYSGECACAVFGAQPLTGPPPLCAALDNHQRRAAGAATAGASPCARSCCGVVLGRRCREVAAEPCASWADWGGGGVRGRPPSHSPVLWVNGLHASEAAMDPVYSALPHVHYPLRQGAAPHTRTHMPASANRRPHPPHRRAR